MPFLKAGKIAVKPENKREKPKMKIRSAEDLVVAMAVKTWLYVDDLATKAELARLGLA